MKLEAEGKARLDAMRKALAAGAPLAGLLAAAVVGASVQGCAGRVMGRFPSQPPEEWAVDGDLAPLEAEREEVPEVPEVPDKPEDRTGAEGDGT